MYKEWKLLWIGKKRGGQGRKKNLGGRVGSGGGGGGGVVRSGGGGGSGQVRGGGGVRVDVNRESETFVKIHKKKILGEGGGVGGGGSD